MGLFVQLLKKWGSDPGVGFSSVLMLLLKMIKKSSGRIAGGALKELSFDTFVYE